jgi:hypothetical protein
LAGKVVGWAFEQSRERGLSPTQRFILVAYADNASEGEGKCWPDKDEIIEKTGYSQATVYRAIKELEAEDLLVFTTDDKDRDCVYLSVPWFSHSENDDSQGAKKNSHSEKRSNKGTVKEPSDKNRQPKKTVGRKVVTDGELDLAAAVVSLFNNSAGTELSVDAHLTPIVGRIRERPTYGEAQHRAIIEAVFAGEHWWTGPPTPQIIYGNPSIFEQSIELARAAQSAKKREEDPNAERERVKREFEQADEADEGDGADADQG